MVAVVIAAAAGCAVVGGLGGTLTAVEPVERVVEIVAQQWGYEPHRIRVQSGDTLRIRLVARDVVHGFFLEGHDVEAEVRPGQPFVVRVQLVNESRRAVRIEGVELATVEDGRRTMAPARVLQRQVPPRARVLVAEYSAVWSPVGSWALEAVAAVEGNERVQSRLKSE